jgi:HSPB1-associated protein 1
VVDLNPGDVLYVPHNWWHYVECLTDSISINSWVDLKIEDDLCRLKEILSKYFIQSVMDSNLVSFEQWINSTEVNFYYVLFITNY